MALWRLGMIVTALSLAGAAPAAAAPGDLDPTFGQGGKVTTSFGTTDDRAWDALVQPDGRIVVAGSADSGTGSEFALARYLPDGSPDPTFSGDGKLTTAFSSAARASAVALQPDGKIVAAGSSSQFAVARYNSDGTLDSTFSDDGLQTVTFEGLDSAANDVAIDARGRIVVAGDTDPFDPINSYDLAVARLTQEGELDTTFSGDGLYSEDLTYDGFERLSAIAPLQDGGFMAVGNQTEITFEDALVTRRFTENGDQLTGFLASRSGRLVRSGHDVTVSADGRATIVGRAQGAASVGVARLRPDGSYDQSLSGDGEDSAQIVAGVDAYESGEGMAVQPAGRIVVGVSVIGPTGDTPPNAAFGLMRFLPDGGLDATFAGDGRQATRFQAGGASVWAVALQGSRIIAVGSAGVGTGNADFAIAAYDGGVLPPTSPQPTTNRGPDSDIRRLGKRVRANRPLRLRGTARDDERVARVDLALLRVQARRGAGRRRCVWLRSPRPSFTRNQTSIRRSCTSTRRFVRAAGTTRWRLRLRWGLPAGRYVLYSRATDNRGWRERRFSARDRNRVAFTVRRR